MNWQDDPTHDREDPWQWMALLLGTALITVLLVILLPKGF